MGDALIEALRFVGRYGAESEQDAAARRIRERNEAASRIAELEAKLAKAVASLDEAAEYVERFADMRDGDYGVPEPNEAMQLASDLRQALASIQERT